MSCDFCLFLRRLYYAFCGIVACRLNLTFKGNTMSIPIGSIETGTIAPTPVGAVVTNVVWSVVPAGAYTITTPDPTGLTAVYTAAVAGTSIVGNVQATAADGTILTDSKPLPDITGAIIATALNLSFAP